MTDILLRAVLGASFDAMPAAVQRMHSISKTQDVRGISRVIGARNFIGDIIRWMASLPAPANRAPLHIRFFKYDSAEGWDRHFGRNRFHTIMKKEGPHLAEHLTALPVTFVYQVRGGASGFSLHPVKVKFAGIPLPRFLWPTLAARASEWRGRYRFSTRVGFWFCGRVISYSGYLDAPQ